MAGSWSALTLVRGRHNGGYVALFGHRYEFTADSSDGTIPDLVLEDIAGFVFGIDTNFDDTTPPNELTTVMKKPSGNAMWSPPKQTASGYMEPDTPRPVTGGAIISFTQTAAATNSAKAVVIIDIGS